MGWWKPRFNLNPISHVRDPYEGCPAMKSNLLQKKAIALTNQGVLLAGKHRKLVQALRSN
jgi:hypothetical protein